MGFLNHEPHHLNQGRMKATQYRRDDWKYEWVGRSFEIAEKKEAEDGRIDGRIHPQEHRRDA